ncbi:choice-of-anchor L domain-containing protein [Flavobacterium sp.]|uniref:T9SS type B sorting domain-containing protein n=1 Tax=Flavobacterium sp. TaxID=239 RepID=UPI003751F09F
MKNTFTLLFCIFSLSFYSQSISVNTNTYTVPQLVNNVLINSPCINATNITWRTGTNFGSTNGIGYFENTNPNFPMQSGVILTTGNVNQAVGPNATILSAGNASWTGDASLEATLAAAGITMTSANATVLEFDFVPLSPHFDFDFLFASEEYGNFQCQFSDAFAFLLTNTVTGVTTNLAVVSGTNTPISVVTIRDFLYNSTCASANSQYFGSFNGGSNAANSATNFNGQTVVLNASASLSPNIPYKIKLVIADRSDYQSDSAIFLSSNSFNIGQEVLGNDLTIANNTAICFNQTTLLDSGLNPTLYSFVWKKNGVVISGQNNPTLTVSQPGTYELTYANASFPCQTVTDFVIVEFLPSFTSSNPKNIYKCDNGSSTYNYDLSINTAYMNIGTSPQLVLSYHTSIADANNNVNALPLNYSSAPNTTVYVRINNPNEVGCYVVKSFELLVTNAPIANQPSNYVKCSSNVITSEASFSLENLNSQILNGQSINLYNVVYYSTLADANAGTNPLPFNYTSSGATIYPRVQLLDDPTCFAVTSANLIVSALPLVDSLEDVITCDSYTLQPLNNGNYFTGSNGSGTALFAGDIITVSQLIYIYNTSTATPSCPNESNFMVLIIEPDQFTIGSGIYCDSYTLPALQFGNYFTETGGNGSMIPGGTEITTNQTVYFYFQSVTPPFCVLDLSFTIEIVQSQDVPIFTNAFDCTSYILQPLTFGNYYDAAGGTGNQIPAGIAITSSQTIYIFGQTANCVSESSFQVVIGIDFPTSITKCAQYVLPQLAVGNYFTGPMGTGTQIAAGTIINTTQTIYVYAVSQSQPNCTDNYNFTVTIQLPVIEVPTITVACENYVLPNIPIGNYFTGSGGTGTALFAGNVLTTSQTIYIYLNDNNGCTNDVSFNVTVNLPPFIDSRSEIDACHSYTLTNLVNGNYFTAPNGTGTMYNGGTVLTTSQLVYIYAVANGCVNETNFQLNIFTIDAQVVANETHCDSYVLPALTGSNKYYTQPNGPFGTGTQIAAGTTITSTQTIYIFIESGERINCTNESSFVVTINKTPVIGTIPNVTVCNSYTLPSLTVGNYFSQSGGIGAEILAGTVLTTNQTLFVYAQTGTTPNCFDEKLFSVTIFNVDQLQDVTICESYILPTLSVGNYYNGANGTGGMIAQGSSISTSKTIYVFANSGFNPNCSDETQFDITIIDTPIANSVPIIMRTVCDEDGLNDGITAFNLAQLNATILGNQTGSEFSITYFATSQEANANINTILNTTSTTAFVRVSNSLAPNCYDVKQITIIVNKLPKPTPKDGIVCIDSKTNTLLNPYVFMSGLSSSTHTFQWFNATGIQVGTGANYQTNVAGTFSVIATNTITGCVSAEVFATANASEPAIIAYTVNEDFANNQVVTIEATGTGGDYEYQLDDGQFQDSPIFDHVMSGIHIITVRDKNGCGTTSVEAIVVNYPKYFTPNGDGFNETWNIVDLSEQQFATIYIYDRYGKLLKQIKPSGQGWDGMYNNQILIADDYWFTISYLKNGESKEFKAHFTLKR